MAKALEGMGTAVNANMLSSLAGTDLAKTVATLSHSNTNEVLQVLEANQRRALSTVDDAVAAAQGRAAPSESGHSEQTTKQILLAAVAITLVVAFRKR
jgi:hypothetical protein